MDRRSFFARTLGALIAAPFAAKAKPALTPRLNRDMCPLPVTAPLTIDAFTTAFNRNLDEITRTTYGMKWTVKEGQSSFLVPID